MPFPANSFYFFGDVKILLPAMVALESFKREPAEFVLRLHMNNGDLFDMSFVDTGNGPVADEAARDAERALIEAVW